MRGRYFYSADGELLIVPQLGRLRVATELGVLGTGERVLSRRNAGIVVSLMATCGMYDESGAYLAATGLPAIALVLYIMRRQPAPGGAVGPRQR